MSEERPSIAAVVLAAGGSSRLGTPKQLIDFRGEPLVRRAARAAAEAGANPVVVVLGAEATEIARALGGVESVSSIVNDLWQSGLASSLAMGIREAVRISPRCDALLIITGDQPLVSVEALRALLDTFVGDARLVAAEYSGTIGVPAIIGSEHFAAMLALEGDVGAGRWLRSRMSEVVRVPIAEAAFDIDTAEDRALLAGI
ncbi:MAG TPA: nucleotidyltransferase family protein [Gemmatimonadaceae bacterium]|nr:nucleotidyltransferase family protein [Gemmatimonadaceae bacterium]